MKIITLTQVMSKSMLLLFLVLMSHFSASSQVTLFNADFNTTTGDNAWSASTSSGTSWITNTGSGWAITNPFANYTNNSFSDYVSPTLNLTGYNNLTLDAEVFYDTEFGWDGIRFEYSIAGGAWTALGTQASGFYNDNDVDAIGNNEDGWSGNSGGGFVARSIDLSAFDGAFDNASNVRFRAVFASDGSNVDRGVAFRDVVVQGIAIVSGPEIDVQSAGVSIPDGNTTFSTLDNTDFGSVNTLSTASNTYTIRNIGTANLTVTSVALSGPDAGQFSVPATSGIIAAGGTLTFDITYTPTTQAVHTATVTLISDDTDEATYTYDIRGTGVAPSYCASSGNTNTFDDVIRRVAINTIDNNTITENNRYSDFTSISTDLQQGSSHNLTVQVNTDGAATYHVTAWIDWNQDFDFTDAGEEYYLGTAFNVTNGATSLSPFNITVPGGAALGSTRMRVMHRYNGAATDPCEDNTTGGEVEDYSLNITSSVPAPEIYVSGNGLEIVDGDTSPTSSDHTNFGGTDIGTPIVRTFTIQNTGNLPLTLGVPALSGTGSPQFSFSSLPATSLSAGASTTFMVSYNPVALATDIATITITNNDSDESPYNFVIQGTGIDSSSQVSVYCQDFNAGGHGWTNTTSTNGNWNRGTEATASAGATGGYMYTARSSGQYSNNSNQVITSPIIDFSGYEKLNLSLDIWYDTSNDSNLTTPTPDGFQIQFSDDGGTTWRALGGVGEATNWYTSKVVYNFGIINAGNFVYINGWTGNSAGWINASIDLQSQGFDNNANVQFRVDFRSDNSTRDVGIAFDNFCITGYAQQAVVDPSCGPAGIGTNLSLWLRADAGTGAAISGNAISTWEDQAFTTSYTNATSPSGEEPTYFDNPANNVNFNPVIKFDPTSSSMYGKKGYYTDEFYIVVKPSSTITSASAPNDIFCGDDYRDSAPSEDVTGFEMGDTSIRFANDVVAFNQGPQTKYGIANVSTTDSYSDPSIFNGRANAANNGADLYCDGLNIGNTEANAAAFTRVTNSRYWLGRSEVFGASYDGDIMEVISYKGRNNDADKQKIQSYLAIKYGITLGNNGTSLDYVDSDGNVIWDVSSDSGVFNNDVAGIGRDDCSSLNQKQSRSVNSTSLLTIGLTDIAATNSANTNSFANDKNYLLWAHDNGNLGASAPIIVDMSFGISGINSVVDFIAVQRSWKVVESGSVGPTKIRIPEIALSATITPPGNFLMFISDTPNFNPTSEYRIMQENGTDLETDYDFNGTKYITFGYAPEYYYERAITFDGTQDYLDADDNLDLTGPFTISAWVNRGPNSNDTDIVSKRDASSFTDGYALRIGSTGYPSMMWKDSGGTTRTLDASVDLPVNEWHQVALTYDGTTAQFYIDGIEDNSASMPAPVANARHFLIGAANGDSPSDFFDGTLDEIRVWNTALSTDQVRFVMNQEIQEHTDNSVMGKIVPQNISKNEVSSIPWASLQGYFPMNRYTFTNVKDESGNNLVAAIKNLDTVDEQTAPLPYISNADGDWDTAATWLNGSTFELPHAVSISDNTQTIDWNIVQSSHNISSQNNTTVLSLEQNANTLSVENDSKMEVTHYLKLDGVIDLQGESQLVQTTNSDLDPASIGSLNRDQQGTADTFTYNYWASPVGTIGAGSNNQDITISSVLYDRGNLVGFTGGYDGSPGNPVILSSFWLYKYNNRISSTYAEWQYVGPTGNMQAGEGWTMKGPGTGGVATPQNYTFTGKPNNSTTTDDITLFVNGGNDYLVGNPFPSALDADDFITDNPQLDGTLYFWEHFGGGSHILSEYQGGYAMYNLSGGTPAVSHPDIDQTGTGTRTPERYVPVAQGFFVKANSDGDILFSNSQRNFVKEGANSIFVNPDEFGAKAASTATEQPDDTALDGPDERPKFRFGFDAPSGLHRQVLLTVDERSSFDYDHGFDGVISDLRGSDMTFMVETRKTIIQGVPNLYEQNIFPLHVRLDENGTFDIGLDGLENDNDPTLHILLWDQLENTFTNLRDADFSIDLETGYYFDRFAVVFKYSEEEPVDDPFEETDANEDEDDSSGLTDNEDENQGVVASTNSGVINTNGDAIKMSVSTRYIKESHSITIHKEDDNMLISKVRMYSMLGQLIKEWELNSKEAIINLPVSDISTGTYLLHLDTPHGIVPSKLIIH